MSIMKGMDALAYAATGEAHSMDDLTVSVAFKTTQEFPLIWRTMEPNITPFTTALPVVIGKPLKPTQNLKKEKKSEAKIDNFNTETIQEATDNTDSLDDDEKNIGMRSRRIIYKNGNRAVQYTSKGYAGWCAQRSIVRARSGLPYERVKAHKKTQNTQNKAQTSTSQKKNKKLTWDFVPLSESKHIPSSTTPVGIQIEEMD